MTNTTLRTHEPAANKAGDRIPTKSSFVMITGATGGLGKAFSVECASRGYDLFLTDINQESLQVLANGLRKTYGVTVLTMPCDLVDPLARAVLYDHICKEALQFWGLINVAGTDYEGPFLERSCQQIRTIIRLNIEALLEMTNRIVTFRDPVKPFRIINVASLAAFYPMPVKAIYAASKRFVVDFSLALRSELRDIGATVTVLCPAGMPTNRECIEAIDAQGLLGLLTTQNVGAVADQTLNAALKGKAMCIPGAINCFMHTAGSLIPPSMIANAICNRWSSVRRNRSADIGVRELSHA